MSATSSFGSAGADMADGLTPVDVIRAAAYTIPTDQPEADGTFAWTATTWSSSRSRAAARPGSATPTPMLRSPADRTACWPRPSPAATRSIRRRAWRAMQRAVRNLGRDGLAATRDLGGRHRAVGPQGRSCSTCRWPPARPLPRRRADLRQRRLHHLRRRQLREQLAGWVERDGCRWVKMKIGTRSRRAIRIGSRWPSAAIGDARPVRRRQRRLLASSRRCSSPSIFAASRTSRWFEEPVSSDDLAGLRLRARRRAGGDGDRGRRIRLHARLFPPHAGGRARSTCCRPTPPAAAASPASCRSAALCEAHHIDLSGALRAGAASARRPAPRRACGIWNGSTTMCASSSMLFDGAPAPQDGVIRPDLSRPGLGLAFKRQDAERYAA